MDEKKMEQTVFFHKETNQKHGEINLLSPNQWHYG